jgi:hypothetical protein
MHVRTRKNTVSFIRTTYDPSTKRGRDKHLGTLPKWATVAPDDLVARLTATEGEELANWLASNKRALEGEYRRSAGLALPSHLQEVAMWYRMQQKSASLSALAKASRDEWSNVLAAMSAAGVGRTRTRQSTKK